MSVAEEMASLFDVNLDEIKSASDYGDFNENNASTKFEDKCNDLSDIVESVFPEEELKTDSDDENKEEELSNNVEEPLEVGEETSTSVTEETLQDIPNTSITKEEDNPLDLEERYAIAYIKIKEKYPRFILHDGSQAFKDFYRWKTRMLTNLLLRFPVIDVKSLSSEIRQVKLNHEVGSNYVSPETIRQRLDKVYSNRARLASLLIECYEQFPSWKKIADMLNSKLFKDHAQRGAHNRDALVLDHMNDVSFYVTELEGFIDSAKNIDHLLQAAAESLSRQLTCIQLKEATGTQLDEGNDMDIDNLSDSEKEQHLDGMDSIDEGTLISKPEAMGPIEENFGIADSDEVSDLIG